MAAALQRGLRAEGFAVDLAHDGEDGLHLALTGEYDIVVLDIMLPRLSGYNVCKRLREAENWVPVLMLSAKDGEYDMADGLDLGADDYLTKPFSYVVLVARLRALLRRGGGRRPSVLRAGDLTLDPARRLVRRGEKTDRPHPREFALLEFLLRHPDEVVSKAEILEHVWDTYDTDPNVVEVYVGYLRRKIDAPFGRGPCRRSGARDTGWSAMAANPFRWWRRRRPAGAADPDGHRRARDRPGRRGVGVRERPGPLADRHDRRRGDLAGPRDRGAVGRRAARRGDRADEGDDRAGPLPGRADHLGDSVHRPHGPAAARLAQEERGRVGQAPVPGRTPPTASPPCCGSP